jgi:hypothetical protein
MMCERCEALRKTAIDVFAKVAALARARRLRTLRINRQSLKTRGPDHPISPISKTPA